MSAELDDVADLEGVASEVARRWTAAQRRQLLRVMAAHIEEQQRARIAAQREPDGAAFAPRRKKVPTSAGAFALRFLYPKGAAEPRVAFLRSWVRQGPIFTGYDQEAGAIRSFFWDRVEKFLPLAPGEQNKSAGRPQRARTRTRPMFGKLRGRRFLRKGADADEAWIGFAGRAAEIARVHQLGLEDRPTARAKTVRYLRRQLIGLSPPERDRMLELLVQQATADLTN
ncbi:phage virion morphogenesis protein [Sphingomonas sp.]|uniref:phage virion morphogenesis protein n=1 Tax=Sphingomonas sp. TaxID=28214 RepID=UPI003B3B65BD